MTRTCTVCAHEQRGLIDIALVNGQALRDIAGQYGLAKSSVERHAAKHIPLALAQAREAVEVAQADDLLAQARSLQARATGILDKAEQSGAFSVALNAIRELRGVIELLARLLATVRAPDASVQQELPAENGARICLGQRELNEWFYRELSLQQRLSLAAFLYPEAYPDDPEYGPNAPERDRTLDTWNGLTMDQLSKRRQEDMGRSTDTGTGTGTGTGHENGAS